MAAAVSSRHSIQRQLMPAQTLSGRTTLPAAMTLQATRLVSRHCCLAMYKEACFINVLLLFRCREAKILMVAVHLVHFCFDQYHPWDSLSAQVCHVLCLHGLQHTNYQIKEINSVCRMTKMMHCCQVCWQTCATTYSSAAVNGVAASSSTIPHELRSSRPPPTVSLTCWAAMNCATPPTLCSGSETLVGALSHQVL